MTDFVTLDEKTSVSGQLYPQDVAELAGRGVTLLVNNRPDGEAPPGEDQPPAQLMAAEAARHGIAFADLPFTGATLTPDIAARFHRLLQEHDGRVHAYCRTGNRSSMLWASAQVASGEPLDAVIQQAAAAGYDLRPAAPMIAQLGEAVKRLDAGD